MAQNLGERDVGKHSKGSESWSVGFFQWVFCLFNHISSPQSASALSPEDAETTYNELPGKDSHVGLLIWYALPDASTLRKTSSIMSVRSNCGI